jgi:DNA repair protein RadC
MSIRDWPEGERPREKLLGSGSAVLSDAELLAVLLGSGTRGKDAIALGRELLINAGSLCALLSRPEQQIRASGLGPAKRARIIAALELARRSLAEELHQRQSLGNPRDSGDYLRARLRHLPYEVFGCLYLDNRHRVLAFEELFRGTVDGASVHPREVVRACLQHNASAVIFAHNHPTGYTCGMAAQGLLIAMATINRQRHHWCSVNRSPDGHPRNNFPATVRG